MNLKNMTIEQLIVLRIQLGREYIISPASEHASILSQIKAINEELMSRGIDPNHPPELS
jgi:hypothetical protein